MTIEPPTPGARVRFARPESDKHFRKGLVGVVRESGVYQADRPKVKYGQDPKPLPPARAWTWVDFPACPSNGALPFGTFCWGDELAPTGVTR